MSSVCVRWCVMLLVLGICACGKGAARGKKGEASADTLTSAEIVERGLVAKPEWIRGEPVDLVMIDRNRDGFVWQCPVDAAVIADGPGVCPNCNRLLEKVDLDGAASHLKDEQIEMLKR